MSWTPRSLREFLAATAAARGEADALVTERARLSWRALEAEAWRVARALRALGLELLGFEFGDPSVPAAYR